MVSCDTCFLTLALVSAFLVVSMDARSWDIAVTIGQQIDFFAQNGTQMGKSYKIPNAKKLMGLAYDNATRTMYMSDGQNKNVSMYSSNLTENESDPYTLLKQTNGAQIMAIAFDPVNRTLFWTDGQHRAIMKMQVPLNESPSTPEMLHDLSGHNPYGIALDICNRFIYWSNCKEASVCTIERSKLDGTDRKVIVSGNLYDVFGLAVDHSDGKLYWVDDTEGDKFRIERSNLDGLDRVLFVNGTLHQPAYIAVDSDAVYWTDLTSEAVWKIKKNKGIGDVPEEFKSYSALHSDYHIMSIITRDNIDGIDCDSMSKGRKNTPPSPITPVPPVESSNDLPTGIESAIQQEKNCLHGGRYDELIAACICKKGFIGSLCETSVCHNYCVHGSCFVDDKGSPKCDCGTSYTGDRCEREERDICDGYCLNNGSCVVSSTGPVCKCENSQGPRCEYTNELDKLCSLYCTGTENRSNGIGYTFCRCAQQNETLPEHLNSTDQLVPSNIILSALVAVIGILVIVVSVLSYHVHKLKRRPRIRKRFVVSKGGVTPLTSRPQVPADSCEITIENCCNMNICETPCFEPKLRATPSKSSSTKVEEKNSLLDSMEGADSC